MGPIKDINGMDLTEAEDIKKRQQGYTEELCKKDLNDPDDHDGVITHLEKAMAPHSSTLAWRIPWAEEPAVHGVPRSQT